MTTATFPVVSLSFDDFYTLPELLQAVEDGYGAKYDDPNNYDLILLYKEIKHFTEADFPYYTILWGSDPDESRSWSHLEAHYDRLSYRINTCGWQLVAREDLERLKLAAHNDSLPHSL